MRYFVLVDVIENRIDYVITSTTTTKEEIQNIIDRVKNENEEWDSTDIEFALPTDCNMLYVGEYGNVERVYY